MLKKLSLFIVLIITVSCASKVIPVNYIKAMKSSEGAHITMIGTLHADLGDLTEDMKAAIDASDVVYIESTQENTKVMMQTLVRDLFTDRKLVHFPGVALSKKANAKLDEVFNHEKIQKIKNKFVPSSHKEISISALTLIIQIALEEDPTGEFLPNSTLKKMENFMRTHYRTILTLKELVESHPSSMDRRIEAYAKDKGKEVKSLDDVYDLVRLSKKITVYGIENSKVWMEFMLGDLEDQVQDKVRTFAKDLIKIKDLYLSDKKEEIAILVDQMQKHEIGKSMFAHRNSRWTSEIDSTFSSNPSAKVVIAVGAGHLEGKRNLQFFLKERNYKVATLK